MAITGAEMKAFRINAEMTQEELAASSGLALSTVRNIETMGERSPSLRSVERYLDSVGATINLVPFKAPTLDDLLSEHKLAAQQPFTAQKSRVRKPRQ